MREPIETTGRTISPAALHAAVEMSAKYPFLVQLVGYHVWRQHPNRPIIDIADVEAARPIVEAKIGDLVHEPALADLSDKDRQFLAAMAVDQGPSRLATIAQRMGVDGNYVNQYRARLLAAELIVIPARGCVDFELPFMREHIRGRRLGLDLD